MNFDLFRQFRPGIERLLLRLFGDKTLSVSINYKLYKGLTRDPNGDIAATYQEFTIPAVPTRCETSAQALKPGVSVAGMASGFIVRLSGFPEGVSVDDLSPNDRICHCGRDLAVTRINRSMPLLVQIFVRGE